MKKLNSSKLAKVNRLIAASIEYTKTHSSEHKFSFLDTSLLLVSDCDGETYPKLLIPVKVDEIGFAQIYPDYLMSIKEDFKARNVQVVYWSGQLPHVNFYFD